MINWWNFRARQWGTVFVVAAAAIHTAAIGQGTLVTRAVFYAHCSARFTFEASRDKNQIDVANFVLLSRQAMELAKAQKFDETDEQLALYSKNFENFLKEKSASNPALETAFAQGVEQCKTRIAKERG